MHVPPPHAWPDRDELLAFMADRRVGHLVMHGPDGLDATLLPFLVEPGEDGQTWGRLVGHLARVNPLARAGDEPAEALVIFAGADAYVSPSWYPSKAVDGKVVPTWNYELVHARGTARHIEDPAWLRAHVGALSDHHEAGRPEPWSTDDAPSDFIDKLTRAIVGIEIELTDVVGKRKLSQNRQDADVVEVIAALAASDRPGDRAVAEAMRP
jgi:transcriptional regulator